MTEEELFDEVSTLAGSMDVQLVDCRLQLTKFGVVVQLIIYSEKGVGTNECAALHRIVGPRLEVLFDNRDVRLEVSSPGLDRRFRVNREYQIFKGRAVRIIAKSGHEYRGVLVDASAEGCSVEVKGTVQQLKYSDIAKTMLDYIKEELTP